MSKKRILIIGAGGHGKVVADIASKNGYKEILFLDDSNIENELVIDKVSNYEKYIDSADFFVAIGNSLVREKILCNLITRNVKIPSLIHPNAVISDDVTIGFGTVIMAGVVINPNTSIGNGVIINTCSSVDHDCLVNDYCHVSVGAHLCGTVKVDKHTWVGAGATVSNNIDICSNCMIGAGAVVVKDIEKPGTYIGVPAKII